MNVINYFKQECTSLDVSEKTYESLDLSILENSTLLNITLFGAALALTAGVVGFVAAAALAHLPALVGASAVCALAALTIYAINQHQCGKAIRHSASITKLFEDKIKGKDIELENKNNEYAELQKKHDELNKQLSDANTKYEELKKGQSHKLLNDKCNELQKKLQTAKEELTTKSEEFEKTKNRLDETIADCKKQTGDDRTIISDLNNEIESQKKKILEQKEDIRKLTGEVVKLNSEKESLEEEIKEHLEKNKEYLNTIAQLTPNGKLKVSIINSENEIKKSDNILNASRQLFKDFHSSDEDDLKDLEGTKPESESNIDEESEPKTPRNNGEQ